MKKVLLFCIVLGSTQAQASCPWPLFADTCDLQEIIQANHQFVMTVSLTTLTVLGILFKKLSQAPAPYTQQSAEVSYTRTSTQIFTHYDDFNRVTQWHQHYGSDRLPFASRNRSVTFDDTLQMGRISARPQTPASGKRSPRAGATGYASESESALLR